MKMKPSLRAPTKVGAKQSQKEKKGEKCILSIDVS